MATNNEPGELNPLTYMLTQAFDSLMRQCMFCLPGKITAFDPETQLAQVECGIQRVVEGGNPRTIPVISNVPVCFPGDGEWYFFHQITPGETEGLIHFAQRAIDTWIDQGGPVAPHEIRMLSEDDAFFVPGVRSKPNAIPNFRNDGAGISNYDQTSFVHLKSDGSAESEVSGDHQATVGGSLTADVTNDATVNAGGSITLDATGDITLDADGDIVVTGSLFRWTAK